MRVLVLFGGCLLEARGTPSRARNLTRALASKPGIDVLALSRDDSSAAAIEIGSDHRAIPAVDATTGVLVDAVNQFQPHLIYGHTHKALKPLVESTRTNPAATVADLHGDLAAERLEQTWRPWPRRCWGFVRERWTERRFLPRLDGYTVVGEPLAKRTRNLGKPTLVLWGGVDPHFFRPDRRSVQGTAGLLNVVYAGNFRPYQGISILLSAAERLKRDNLPFRYTLIGDHAAFPEEAQRAKLSLGKRVSLLGQVPYERMPSILSAADILVIPRPDSRTARFGFPSKLAEYLSMGRAVVATRVGDQERAISDGTTGVLIEPDSIDSLENALRSLQDDDLRNSLGTAGRQFAQENLDWNRLASQSVEFFDGIIA